MFLLKSLMANGGWLMIDSGKQSTINHQPSTLQQSTVNVSKRDILNFTTNS